MLRHERLEIRIRMVPRFCRAFQASQGGTIAIWFRIRVTSPPMSRFVCLRTRSAKR